MITFCPVSDIEFLGAIEKHFQDRISNIRFLLDSRTKKRSFETEVFILVCCTLDAFSKLFYEASSQERFVSILYDFGKFKNVDFNRVSLPGLWKNVMLKKVNSPYIQVIRSKMKNINYSEISRAPESEPIKEDLIAEMPEIRNLIRESTYANLLYVRYRCNAVHVGYPQNHWCLGDENYVHYVNWLNKEGAQEDSELMFPEKFVTDLLDHIVKKVLEDNANHIFR
jgi:hypothetical protein